MTPNGNPSFRGRKAETRSERIEVLEHFRLPGRVAQDEGGMVRGEHGYAVPFPPLPARPGDLLLDSQQEIQRGCTEGADDFGADRPNLAQQERKARLRLVREGDPVPRRAALHDVGDVDVLPPKADPRDPLIEPLPGGSDERLPPAVLLGPRPLADEHQPGAGVPHPEDDRAAPRAKRASA